MNPGLMGLIASMAPTEEIQQRAGLLSMLPNIGNMSSQQTSFEPGAPASTSNWENVARQQAMEQYGYNRRDWRALDSIIERESGWNPQAVNDNGGAYGIPQILPSAHPGLNLQNDPQGQLDWLFKYIEERYGGPRQALQFKNANNWY
jgi:hypothetical protein